MGKKAGEPVKLTVIMRNEGMVKGDGALGAQKVDRFGDILNLNINSHGRELMAIVHTW